MRLLAAALGLLALAALPASAANMCRAGNLTCATTMPVGGYCECTKGGQTTDGTVEARPARRQANSTAGGCGARPNAPGCH